MNTNMKRSVNKWGMLAFMSVLLAAAGVTVATPDYALPGEKPGFPLPNHVDQHTINEYSFQEIYRWGEALFNAPFNRLDGVGANLSLDEDITIRFSRTPRADLPGFLINPRRPDGPESQNCAECHRAGRVTGGSNVFNESRDPYRTADPSQYILRNTSHLAGAGALQLLAEQTTIELMAVRARAIAGAQESGDPVTMELVSSNNVHYGRITAFADGTLDLSQVKGVAPDLVVKPYHLKGEVPFLRFLVSASTDVTIGMQGPERVQDGVDADYDGVVNELTVGDHTALTVYIAARERPVSKLELHKYIGGKYRLDRKQIHKIKKGERIFEKVGCADCHTPKLILKDPIFREPSSSPFHRFSAEHFPFLTGADPLDYGLDPANPVTFDLRNNPTVTCEWRRHGGKWGNIAGQRFDTKHRDRKCFNQFETDGNGNVIVRSYGNQKRYDMGPKLAEAVDEFGDGISTWRAKELWGVGDTGPWLHDGRATTLPEAIWWHGGEAQEVRDRYFELPVDQQEAVIEFLKSLVLYIPDA